MKIDVSAKQIFYFELAKLSEAGFGIREALDIILEAGHPAAVQNMAQHFHDGLENGDSITDALEHGGTSISHLETSIIGAGERGGRLPSAFRHMSDYFDLMTKSRHQILRNLIYPALLLHLAVAIGSLPSDLLINGLSTSLVASRFITGIVLVYLLTGVGFFLCRSLLAQAQHSPLIDRFINRIPLLGKTRQALAMARFTRVYHTAILAGLSMKETVSLASEASLSGQIRDASEALLKQLDTGDSLGPTFVASKAFPKAFSRSYASAEKSGSLDKDLNRWAQQFQDQALSASQGLTTALPKILHGLILAFLIWRIVSFYTTYLRLLDSIDVTKVL